MDSSINLQPARNFEPLVEPDDKLRITPNAKITFGMSLSQPEIRALIERKNALIRSDLRDLEEQHESLRDLNERLRNKILGESLNDEYARRHADNFVYAWERAINELGDKHFPMFQLFLKYINLYPKDYTCEPENWFEAMVQHVETFEALGEIGGKDIKTLLGDSNHCGIF